ncbi:xaa-Pro aminopeptidase 1-like [Amphiura filiformis]|uniref:xaa-Pro aminopeptidase 1-like n=1 Tax=Amphiura filiformis TaxID=82378 RepID=UPI003B20E8BA
MFTRCRIATTAIPGTCPEDAGGEYDSYNSTFEAADGGNPVLVSVVGNLVDIVWGADAETPQPDYPDEPLLILDWEKYTGETWQQKIWEYDGSNGLDSIRSKLNEASADAIVVSKLDEVAWLFNLRGKDVPSNPMFFSYAIIKLDAIYLYLYDKDGRLVNDVKTHLGIGTGACVDESTTEAPECVTVRDYSKFLGDLETLSEDRIWISDQMSYAIYDRSTCVRYLMASPVLLMKAVKSPKEIEGMNNAHFKDSIVLCELGAWLQETMDELEDPAVGDIEVLSELIVADKAMKLREAMPDNEGLSFGAISAFGPNGAVIHYKSTEESNVPITNQGTFLFDSGSQYLDGTVDITRTFHFGEPSAFVKEAYTRVLLGHIDLALGTFRTGIYGREIDVLAREPLWRNGLDYNHGTGHGIGHFLNVHEQPARIRIGYRSHEEPLELGMFQSDEPGYYEDNVFGIRIEDIMYTVEAETDHKFNDYTYMTWKMCSLVPLEPKMINFEMFTPKEIDWYNAYNQRIITELGPALMDLDDGNLAYDWMMSKTGGVEYEYKVRYSAASSLYVSFMSLISLSFIAVIFGI